ncbi:hypothetical protein BOX15_Mlig009411g1, partial [Macrostomum lignano]
SLCPLTKFRVSTTSTQLQVTKWDYVSQANAQLYAMSSLLQAYFQQSSEGLASLKKERLK